MGASKLSIKRGRIYNEFRPLYADMKVLLCLARKPGLNQKQIANLTGLSKKTVSRHLRQLEHSSSVLRKNRSFNITPDGSERLMDATKALSKLWEELPLSSRAKYFDEKPPYLEKFSIGDHETYVYFDGPPSKGSKISEQKSRSEAVESAIELIDRGQKEIEKMGGLLVSINIPPSANKEKNPPIIVDPQMTVGTLPDSPPGTIGYFLKSAILDGSNAVNHKRKRKHNS